MKKFLLIVIILILGGALYLNYKKEGSTILPNEPVACTMDAKVCPDGSYVGRVGPSCEFAACPASSDSHSDLIKVFSPVKDAVVKSPLTISGEARGNWYFEASFPVYIYDANGKQLGVVPATAQGEWMTTNFVPFSVVLNFETPTTPTGKIVLQKDNASGLPEFDDQIEIPVRFTE